MNKIVYTNDLAKNYNKYHFLEDNYFKLQFDTIKNLLNIKNNSIILDVGCGSGRILKPMSKFCNILGIEKSVNMYNEVVKSGFNNIINLSAQEFETRDKYDGIYFSMSLHQMGSKLDQINILKKYFKFLNTGGKLLLITISHNQFKEIPINKYFKKVTLIDKNRFLSIEDIEKHFNILYYDQQSIYTHIPNLKMIEKLENKYISSLQLLSDTEHKKGLKKFKKENKNDIYKLVDCYTYILLG